jgi:hypothetical protein
MEHSYLLAVPSRDPCPLGHYGDNPRAPKSVCALLAMSRVPNRQAPERGTSMLGAIFVRRAWLWKGTFTAQ